MVDFTKRQTCKLCNGSFSVQEILALAKSYRPELNIIISSTPSCSSSEELQLKDGLKHRDYTYAGGGAHFAAMQDYAAPNLKVI